MQRMGDSRRIDHLRALALSSMPSLSRRPSLRRNSGSVDAVERRKGVVAALPVIPDDKEEGELSSDDEIERTSTPPAAVETSLSFAHRNAGFSVRAHTQGNLKDERHTSAADPAECVPFVGVPSASVFSTSTRVSIVNKSQLFSAFTAQAPPLISSQTPDQVHSGSGVEVVVRQPTLPEVTSSGALLNTLIPSPYHEASGNSFQASSRAASQQIPTLPELSRSQANKNSLSRGTFTQNSSLGFSTGLPVNIPVSSAILPGFKRPNPPTAAVDVTSTVSPVLVPFTTIGVPDSIGATSGQALVAGVDVSIALGTASAVSVSATPVIVSAGLRKEAGVRKEAEAFLASLRIPLSNSGASGDEKEGAFLIKFDEDSDSDGENENRTNSIPRHSERSSRKGTTSSVGLMTTSAPLQSTPVMPNQSPADLTAEIELIKKQIAAMERTKGKTGIPSVLGKAVRVLSTDTSRNMVNPGTELRAGTHGTAVNGRPASADLESMRLRIAAKESELQQRRQRLAVKVPESGRGVSDPKRTGGVVAYSLPPSVKSSQTADSAAAHAGNSIEKSSSEKVISGYKKEVQLRADGIPALALAGPAGANLAGLKKIAEQRLLDGFSDHQCWNGSVSNLEAVQGSHVSRVTGQQPLLKGMKRLRADGENSELAKAPRTDNDIVAEESFAKESSKEVATLFNTNDNFKGGRTSLSLVQTSKRKVDDTQTCFDKALPGSLVDVVSATGSEAMKKLKTTSGVGLSGSRHYVGEELLPNSIQHAQRKDQLGAQAIPRHDVLLSTIFPREKGKSPFPNSDNSLKTATATLPYKGDGIVGICVTEHAPSLSDPLPLLTERQRGSGRFQENADDVLVSSTVIHNYGANGNAEALRLQQATDGLEISRLPQPNVKARDVGQTAIRSTVAVTERQQEAVGRLNPNPPFTIENRRVRTTQPGKPVNPVPSTNFDYHVEHSFHPSHSRTDNQQLDGEQASFQQLLEEEELLDKQLEEVQGIRQRCEVRERNARREYREAQLALRAANSDCHTLNQRKELLLSRMHAAEARHLSVNSYTDRPLVASGGTLVTKNQSRPENPLLLVTSPDPVPVSHALELSWEEDVNVEPGRLAQTRESLSPFSSNRVDLAAVVHRDAKSVVSAEEGEENSRYKLAKSISSDDKEHESHGQLIAGVESSGRLENHSADGMTKTRAAFGDVEGQEDIEPESVVDRASHAENQAYIRSESAFNNNASRNPPSAGLDSGPLVSNLAAEGRNRVVTRTYASDTGAGELPQGTLLEDSEHVPWSPGEGSRQTQGLCLGNDISSGGPRTGRLSAVGTEGERHQVLALHHVPKLDLPQVMDEELEQEGSDKEHRDVKRITASSSSEDAQSGDSLRSPPDLLQGLDTTEVHESVNTGEDLNTAQVHESVNKGGVTLMSDDALQEFSTGNISPRTLEDDALPVHLNACRSGPSGSTCADTDCGVTAGNQDESVPPVSKECALQIVPETSFSVLEDWLLGNEIKAVQSCAISRAYAGDRPFNPEVETKSGSVSHDVLGASGARDEIERSNSGSLVEVPRDTVGLNTDREQSSSHLPLLKMNTLNEKQPDLDVGDFAHIQNSDATLLDTEQEIPVIPGNSSNKEAPPHHNERKAQAIDESSEQTVSATLLHSGDAIDDPIVLDSEMVHMKDGESPEGVPGVYLAGDAACPNGTSGRESSSAPKAGSSFLNLQEGMDSGVFNDDCLAVRNAESTDAVSDNGLTEQFTTTSNDVGHDTSILQNQYCQPASNERDSHCDNSTVTQLADSANVTKTGVQVCAEILEEQNPDTTEVPQQPTLKISLDDNSTTELFDYKKEDPVQDTVRDPGRIIESEMITDNSESLSQNELGNRDYNLAISLVAEEQQQDQSELDMSESEEQKQEDSEKKESKGADVEVFRKALLEGNVFERRSSSGEVAETTNFIKQSGNEVSKQILPQLQHHRLEHLLDMVEVGEQEISNGGDILVREGLHGEQAAGSLVVVDELQLDTLTLESHDIVDQSREQALSFSAQSEIVSDAVKHWVPSADSLAVLSLVRRAVGLPSESGTRCETDEMPLPTSLDTGVVLPYRYKSPLSIFRSYRILPQFSDDLHLSRSSATWSHAIDPFRPLCKFEHRGKCNNDDCPWQHADDYTLSSSQVVSQIQNFVNLTGLTSVDHDVSTCIDNGGELAIAGISLPAGDSPVIAMMAQASLDGPRDLQNSSMAPLTSCLKWNSEVPVYRIGSYTQRAEDLSRMSLIPHDLQLGRKVDSLHSFLLSPSIHRPLPSDIPCLLEASETSSWVREAPAYQPESPHWRYMREIQEKLMCSKDGGELQELIDEEMWLELALHQIDYDISTDNNKARDQALFYLSRALEKKRCSVTLWVVYSCLFHMRNDNQGKDDMFHYAVQYNPGSYELWILYINSRSDCQSRLEAYQKAIVALANEGTQLQLDKEELSSCILDIGLQMLYFWCISSCSEDSFSWLDDLIRDASAEDGVISQRGSTTALLSHLTQHDACVLWIACTYLLACKHLPNTIVTRLGCKQELPDELEWEKHAKVDEESHKLVMKALSTAASEGLGCLSLGSVQSVDDKDKFAKQVLGVNYVQCLAFYEGLDSAACMGKKLISLHPTSLELIVVCARIDERRKGFTTGLHVFEEAVLQWPRDLPGTQRLWNQYAGHALLWGGTELANTVLLACAATETVPTIDEIEVSQRKSIKLLSSMVNLERTEATDCKESTVESLSHVREYFVMLTSVSKRTDGGTITSHQLSHVEDAVYALINLALVEALSGDIAASQSAINSAMKAAIFHKDLRQCWRELAAFQQVFCAKSEGLGTSKLLEQSMLSLLDRCKTDSINLSQLRPLSEKAFQNYKKPHVRIFLEDLFGPPPLDHSVINSILGTSYGSQLLPADSYPLKEVFHFAEGILEAIPGNFVLASSLCKIVGQNRSTLKRMYLSAVMWASTLLISSLHQSCPVAPEVYWVEAGSLLRQLDEERSLEEFYKLALFKYPFSAALRRCLQEVQDPLQVPDAPALLVQHRSLKLVAAEPMQVAVQC